MTWLGDWTVGETRDFFFTTRKFSSGAPNALASGVISAYEDNSTTQITAGITLTADFDTVTGLNHVRVVASGANGFEAGKSYGFVITTGTVDSVSVVGEVVGQCSIERGASYTRIGTTGSGLTTLATQASVNTIDDFLDTEVAAILAAVDTEVATLVTNVAAILADTGTDGVIVASLAAGSITATVIADNAIDAASIAADAITAAKIATGAIDADSIAADAITATKIATGAITAAKFAAGAVDAAALAADAVDEIWDEAMSGHTTAGTYGDKLRASLTGVLKLTIGVGSSTTALVFSTVDGAAPSATNDFYNGRVVVFISGTLAGQATDITDYVGATTTATVTALTGSAANGDTAVIV